MVDLSNWNCANEFTAAEAASLIVGEDINTHPGPTRHGPAYGRIAGSYGEARNRARGFWEVEVDFYPRVEPLSSIDLDWYREDQAPGARVSFDAWLQDEAQSGLQLQRFARNALAEWLRVTGIPSTYQFDLAASAVPVAPVEKPLGTTERNTLLTIIAVLAKEANLSVPDFRRPGKVALAIEGMTLEFGHPVSKRAIEDHLKKIPDALASRAK